MGGPNEAKLEKVTSAHPAEIYRAAGTWTKAVDGLKAVADQIDSAKAEIAAAWSGKDASAFLDSLEITPGKVKAKK